MKTFEAQVRIDVTVRSVADVQRLVDALTELATAWEVPNLERRKRAMRMVPTRFKRPPNPPETLVEHGIQEALLRSDGMTSLVRFATVPTAEWSSPVICLESVEELMHQEGRK